MTDKELRKLSRVELLEILLEQSKMIDELNFRIGELSKDLQSRRMVIARAGSIAEAALKLNEVFDVAQRAADQYLESVKFNCEAAPDKNIPEATVNVDPSAAAMLENTRRKCRQMEKETAERCKAMIIESKIKAAAFWEEVHKNTD